MTRAYHYPVWTPRSFNDGSLRWLVDEPTALRTVVQLGGVRSPRRFGFEKRRTVERTVTFPSFTLRERDLLFRVPWLSARRQVELELYVAVEHESAPAALARVRAFCLTGGVWQDDWARWERESPPREPFQPLFTLPVLFYTGEEPWSGPAELAQSCGVPGPLMRWAPSYPMMVIDLKRQPDDVLGQVGPFGRVLGVLQAERQHPVLFGERLRKAVQEIEHLPAGRQPLGRRWLWYIYCLMHHRRPVAEHQTWRDLVHASVTRQKRARR